MYEELMEKVGLTIASSAQETESVPSTTLPVMQLERHRNILSISPIYLYKRMYLLKGGNCSSTTSFNQ